MSEQYVWKFINRYNIKVKHLFPNKGSILPWCGMRPGTFDNGWCTYPERLKHLKECESCLKKERQSREPKIPKVRVPVQKEPFDPSKYTWKYIDSLLSTSVHAFRQGYDLPICGRSPDRYGVHWQDDEEEVKKRVYCKDCIRKR